MILLMTEMRLVDARTFEIEMKEPYGVVIESLSRPSVVVPFMMPRRVAETDPSKQLKVYVGGRKK